MCVFLSFDLFQAYLFADHIFGNQWIFPLKFSPDFSVFPTLDMIEPGHEISVEIISLNCSSFELFVCFIHYTCFAHSDANLNIIGLCAQRLSAHASDSYIILKPVRIQRERYFDLAGNNEHGRR